MYLVSFITTMVKQTMVKVHTFSMASKKEPWASSMLMTLSVSLRIVPARLLIMALDFILLDPGWKVSVLEVRELILTLVMGRL